MTQTTGKESTREIEIAFPLESQQGEICWGCPSQSMGREIAKLAIERRIPLIGCKLAIFEKLLGRVPTLGEAMHDGATLKDLAVPSQCPNKYRRPDDTPLAQ